MIEGRKSLGALRGELKSSVADFQFTAALSATAHTTGLIIPKEAVVKAFIFRANGAGGTAAETVTFGWAASNVKGSNPGTQTGVIDEAASAAGLASLTAAQWVGASTVRVESPYALAKKRFEQDVAVTLTPSAASTGRTSAIIHLEIQYVIE